MPPAARLGDTTTHMSQPLAPGPGSMTTIIGFKPAWRAVPAAAAAGLQAAKAASDTAIKALEETTKAAPDPTSKAAAVTAETTAKTSAITALGNAFAATGADIHACTMPSAPVPSPHGPGVVLQASTTVVVDNLPLCRQGDKVVEALGGPNSIVLGDTTVIVG